MASSIEIEIAIEIETTPERVWDILADGWLYPLWVVGATRVRDVDDDWPGAGARIHHSIGAWPVVINDVTEVLDSRPRDRLRLRAKGWPLGEAEVELKLRAQGVTATTVTIVERPISGPGSWLPGPVERLALRWRNIESLRRLGFIAVGRAGGDRPAELTSGDPRASPHDPR